MEYNTHTHTTVSLPRCVDRTVCSGPLLVLVGQPYLYCVCVCVCVRARAHVCTCVCVCVRVCYLYTNNFNSLSYHRRSLLCFHVILILKFPIHIMLMVLISCVLLKAMFFALFLHLFVSFFSSSFTIHTTKNWAASLNISLLKSRSEISDGVHSFLLILLIMQS